MSSTNTTATTGCSSNALNLITTFLCRACLITTICPIQIIPDRRYRFPCYNCGEFLRSTEVIMYARFRRCWACEYVCDVPLENEWTAKEEACRKCRHRWNGSESYHWYEMMKVKKRKSLAALRMVDIEEVKNEARRRNRWLNGQKIRSGRR